MTTRNKLPSSYREESMDTNVNYFQSPADDTHFFTGTSNAPVVTSASPAAQQVAPPVEAAPIVDETGGDDIPTVDDYAALLRERDSLAEARKGDRAQIERFQADRMQAQNELARQAWNKLEAQAKAAAAEMEYEQSHAYLSDFYRQREQAIINNSNDMLMRFAGNVYVKDVIERYGLDEKDAVMLGSDPNRYDEIAERIKSERDAAERRYADLESKIKQSETSQYVQQRVASGAYVNGGGGGRNLPVDTSKLSERDHLRYLMTGELPAR